MPFINQIEVNSVTYDIRDSSAASASSVIDLDGRVSSLENDSSLLTDYSMFGKHIITVSEMESGTWAYSNKSDNSKRLRNKELYPVFAGMAVRYTNPTLKICMAVLQTKSSNSLIQYSGWLNSGGSGTYTIDYDGYLVFMCQSENDITVSDYDCTVDILSADSAAIDTWLSELANDSSAYAVTGEINISGKAINTSGVQVAVDAGSCSGYIHIYKGWNVAYSGLKMTSNYNVLSFYRPDRSYVSGVASQGASTGVSGTFTAPYDGYIRLCVRTDLLSSASAVINSTLKQKFSEINTLIGTLSDGIAANAKSCSDTLDTMYDNVLVAEGTYKVKSILALIKLDGAVTSSGTTDVTQTDYKHSAFLRVLKDWKINYKLRSAASYNLVSFYTSANSSAYQSGVAGNGASWVEGVFTVPSDGYIRICGLTSVLSSAYVNVETELTSRLTTIEADIDGVENNINVINNRNLINTRVSNDSYKSNSIIDYFTLDGSISTSGVGNDDSTKKRTYKIRVLKDWKISYKLKLPSTMNVLSYYDNNEVYQSGITGDGANWITSTFTVPDDGFVILSSQTADMSGAYAYIVSPLVDRLKGIDQNKSDIAIVADSENIIDLKPMMTANYTISTTGTFTYNANYVRSGFIYMRKGWKVIVSNIKCSTNYNALAFYTNASVDSYYEGFTGNGVTSSARFDKTYTAPVDGYIVVGSQAAGLSGSSVKLKSSLELKFEGLIPDTTADEIISALVEEGRAAILEHNESHRCLTFALITDTHMYKEAQNFACRNNVRLFAEMAKYTDFAVHCGDVAESGDMTATGLTTDTYVNKATHWQNYCEFIGMVNGIKTPLYICHGNHDVSRYNKSVVPAENAITAKTWSIESKRLAGNVVYNTADPFSNYYYVDLDDFKCRIIVSDYFNQLESGAPVPDQGMNDTEKYWMQHTAMDLSGKTTPSAWTILMFNHAKQISSIASSINALRTSQNPNNFILIHGNDHVDDYTNDVFSTSSGSSSQYAGTYFNNIGVDKSFVKTWLSSDHNGTIGTETEYCVDVFCIDFTDGIIYETRLGRGNDRKYKFGSANTSEANNIITD